MPKEEQKLSRKNPDYWFDKIRNAIMGAIGAFVAFLFMVFMVGALYGAVVATKSSEMRLYLLVAPAVVGLIAYYNRTFSLIIFAAIILFFIIL